MKAAHREHLVNLFVKQWETKPLREDGSSGLNDAQPPTQCVNVSNEWLKFLGLKFIQGNAIDLPNNADRSKIVYTPNTPTYVPHRGDIFVMNHPPADPIYGHTGLVIWATVEELRTLEQNWADTPFCEVMSRNYVGVEGFLRPKCLE